MPSVEAMACGCALVSVDSGGSREYAIHEQTALVTTEHDAGTLAGFMVSLLRDESACVRLAERGRRFVQRFQWAESAAVTERALEQYRADPAPYQRRGLPTFEESPELERLMHERYQLRRKRYAGFVDAEQFAIEDERLTAAIDALAQAAPG
jgi:hypothetical protein